MYAPILYPPGDLWMIEPGSSFIIGVLYRDPAKAREVLRGNLERAERERLISSGKLKGYIARTDRKGRILEVQPGRVKTPKKRRAKR